MGSQSAECGKWEILTDLGGQHDGLPRPFRELVLGNLLLRASGGGGVEGGGAAPEGAGREGPA